MDVTNIVNISREWSKLFNFRMMASACHRREEVHTNIMAIHLFSIKSIVLCMYNDACLKVVVNDHFLTRDLPETHSTLGKLRKLCTIFREINDHGCNDSPMHRCIAPLGPEMQRTIRNASSNYINMLLISVCHSGIPVTRSAYPMSIVCLSTIASHCHFSIT